MFELKSKKSLGIHGGVKEIVGKDKDKEQNPLQKVPWTLCVDQKWGVN